jgi:hypothetical protein
LFCEVEIYSIHGNALNLQDKMQRVLDEVVRHVASSSISSSAASALAAPSISQFSQNASEAAPAKVVGGGGLAAVRSRKPLAAVQASTPSLSPSVKPSSLSLKKGKTSSEERKKNSEERDGSMAPESVAGEAVVPGAQMLPRYMKSASFTSAVGLAAAEEDDERPRTGDILKHTVAHITSHIS